MKYMPTYDQVVIMDLGLKSQHGHLIDLLINAALWADKTTVDGSDFYFLDYGKIIEEIPTVVKSKPRITAIVKQLKALNIVETIIKGRSNWFKVEKDLIKFWGKDNKNEEYKLMLERKFNMPKSVQETERSGNGTFRKRNDKEGNRSGNGTVIVPKTEPINQPSNKPTINKPTKEKKGKTLEIPDSINMTALNEFEEHRKSIKVKLTPLAKQKIITKLSKFPKEIQQDMVDLTIENGWKGVFEPKNYKQTPPKAISDNLIDRMNRGGLFSQSEPTIIEGERL